MPYKDEEKHITVDVPFFLGLNTATKPGSLAQGQWRAMKNAYQVEIGDCTKRPGTVPVTTSPLGATIKHMTDYKSSPSDVSPELFAASGTTLYKFDGTNAFVGQTMTNPLASSDIYTVPFTDANTVSVLFITDGGNMKQYSAGAVIDIVPAASEPDPVPANNMTTLNTKNMKYCWVHKDYLFVSDGKDAIYYTKKYTYNYFPSTYYNRFVRGNDYITGPGISYSDVCMIPMRRGWGMLTGSDFDDFNGNVFLNTNNGCISGRTIQRITKPGGDQTIVFLSDDGVHEIYDTGAIVSGSRQYSTRSLMKDKIEFPGMGFTDAEKKAAISYFDTTYNLYMLFIKRDTTNYVYCLDVRNNEWYVWTNLSSETVIRSNGTLYFAGSDGHLKKFDDTLASDWTNSTKTIGTPVDWDVITDMISFEESGFASMLDYILVWAKQYPTKSSMDIYVNRLAATDTFDSAVQTQVMIWGSGVWGESVWYNANLTDLLGKPVRLTYKKKSYFFQIRFKNDRDELVKLHHYKLMGRTTE